MPIIDEYVTENCQIENYKAQMSSNSDMTLIFGKVERWLWNIYP